MAKSLVAGQPIKTYTTISGDTWDGAALKALGSEIHTNRLMEANPALIGTVVFQSGVVLLLPDITPEAPATAPPWRVSF